MTHYPLLGRAAAMCRVALIGLALLLAGWLGSAYAEAPLNLTTHQQPVNLAGQGDYWIDTTGQYTAEQVADDTSIVWRPTHDHTVYPVSGTQALWIRLNALPTPEGERWYLEVVDPALNVASLFTKDAHATWLEQRAGDQIDVAKWPVPHRYPLLPLALSTYATTQYLLRLENGTPISAPLHFVSEGYLSHSEQRVSLVLGMFFGLLGLAVLMCTISALLLRDATQGWYALLALLLGVSQSSATGIGGLHLWPHAAAWNDASKFVLPMLVMPTALMFIASAVSTAQRMPRLHRLMQFEAVLGLAIAGVLLFTPSIARGDLLIPIFLLVHSSALGVLLWAWMRGDRLAPWILLSFVPVLASAGWVIVAYLGWVPKDFLTQYCMQIGVALHLSIVMAVLTVRSQQRRDHTRRILRLDRVDPATGLIRQPVFLDRLQRMIARSERLQQRAGVMLVDILNIEQIQRDFGRTTAEDLPVRVAERLRALARDIDTAARLSPHSYGLLLEGPFSAQDAARLAPIIVARCLMPFEGLPAACVGQVRVAYALVPPQGGDAAVLLAQLQARLANAPADGRAVFALA